MTVDSLGQQSANAALAHLDSCDLERDSFQGPFGVLKVVASEENSRDESQPDWTELSQMDFGILWDSLDATGSGLYGLTGGSEDALQADPLLDVDIQNLLPGSLSLTPNPSLPLSESKHIPPLAPDLLRYFKENVVSLSFPLKNRRKCPWQTIHLPSVMSTFAELSIDQTASHTRLSLFYSLLAASCLHMYSRNQSAVEVNTSGKKFKEIAKQHLEFALNEEVLGSKQAKYKEILMAVLSMVMLSVWFPGRDSHSMPLMRKIQVFHGEDSNAQAFLVDAEYLIRIRGLLKPHKSVKVRSLHHVYTYLRIMAESTCGCALLDICPDRPSSSLLTIGDSSPISLRSFRVARDSLDAEINMALEKSNKIGHNDIHLEVMGHWKDTLFPDIYGIPESLMTLLSQVIRLANEQELLHRGPTVDMRVAGELKRRASTLEQYILSWEPPPSSSPSSLTVNHSAIEDGQAAAAAAPPLYFMMRAMHQALILFYYRRVPNISALILQDTVRKCLDFLVRSDASHDTTILWPGFVAACEALDPDLQHGLLDWLVATGHRTSLGSFSAAAGTAQCVWKGREKTKDYTLSWFDVMRHEKCPIIVT